MTTPRYRPEARSLPVHDSQPDGKAEGDGWSSKVWVVSKSEEHRVVTLWGYVCRDPLAKVAPRERITDDGTVVDHSGEVVDVYELEKAVWDYVENSREGDVMHTDAVTMMLVGSMTFTPELKKMLGLDASFPEGTLLQYRVHDDDAWEAVKSGKLSMGSLLGSATKEPIG